MEQKYELTKQQTQEKTNLKFSAKSSNLKRNLETLFYELNQIESITTKHLYNKSLELFNVEIRQSGRGHVVFVADGNGNPVRYPIRLSDFRERPKFYVSAKEGKQIQQHKTVIDRFQLAQLARDLNRLVERSKFSELQSKQRLKRKRKQKRF